MIPGVKGQPASREEAQAFHESERNCNTCAHLSRIQQSKQTSGLYYGYCMGSPIDHPYPIVVDGDRPWLLIKFAPDDCMNMACWQPRPSVKPAGD